MDSEDGNETVDGNRGFRKAIYLSAERRTGSHEPFSTKLALGQCGHVLIQGILASQ